MRKVYRERDIEVSFDLDICIHVGECLTSLPDVFDTRARPWVDTGAESAEDETLGELVERSEDPRR